MSSSQINTAKREELAELLAALPQSNVVKTQATGQSQTELEQPTPPQSMNVDRTKVTTDDSVKPSSDPEIPHTVISGYELECKLGAGGYGEVWKAKGPGGLPKAVKILYGQQDGTHAEAELKSLERMRDLRHPFLLSIERIEVVDNRLIVVTELADGNLTDRFKEHRSSGKPGIPRDELLAYLRDAADALDFMSDNHGLQHLDIKPDNILVLGNHAKIGDFGLAKDLNVVNMSMVNGFTPLYAGPEIFEGKPGRSTDQYSLAIVYQVMLTGKPPFNGRNAAQLTAQHLRSQPDLSDLQPIDRPVIARALSKVPHSRYSNCREFVDELSRRKVSRTTVSISPTLPIADASQTDLVDTAGVCGNLQIASKPSAPVSTSPIDASGRKIRPSIVISTGGVAGEVIQKFREETGGCVPILHLDTDRESIVAVQETSKHGSVDEAVYMPLRSSKEFRSARQLDLSWLSRRWLFNIPRSNQVNGIRPLGRLALYDHRNEVNTKIKATIQHALSHEGRESLKQFSQCEVDDSSVDVYVLGTTFGGTSSGTVNDIGLMIRQLARQCGWRNLAVQGVLVHSTGTTRSTADVQEANAVSLLKELKHLSTPGMGTPRGFMDSLEIRDDRPFDQICFFEVPTSSTENRIEFERIVSYLKTATSTAAQFDLEAWRAQFDEDSHASDSIRLIGAATQDLNSLDSVTDEARDLTMDVIRHWCDRMLDDPGQQATTHPAHLSDCMTLMEQLALTENSLSNKITQLLQGDIGRNLSALASQYTEALQQNEPSVQWTRRTILQWLEARVTESSTDTELSLQKMIGGLRQGLSAVSKNCEQQLKAQIFQLLDSPGRLNAAWHGSQLFVEALQDTQRRCEWMIQNLESALDELFNSANPDAVMPDSNNPDGVEHFVQQYCLLFGHRAVYQSFQHHLRQLSDFAAQLAQRLKDQRVRIRTLVKSPAAMTTTETIAAFDQALRNKKNELSKHFFAEPLNTEQFFTDLLRQATQFLLVGENSHSNADSTRKVFPANAWPGSEGLGGRRRVTALLPEDVDRDAWQKRLTQEFGNCVATRKTPTGHASVICEIEGVTIAELCDRLTATNPHVAELAGRVHVRNDVNW